VTLKNGDRLTGTIVKSDTKTLLIKTELAGDVTVLWDAEEHAYDRLQHPRLIDLWSGLLDTGLSETRGNSALLAFTLSAKAAREARHATRSRLM
jgi:hypothetical protein